MVHPFFMGLSQIAGNDEQNAWYEKFSIPDSLNVPKQDAKHQILHLHLFPKNSGGNLLFLYKEILWQSQNRVLVSRLIDFR